MSKVHVSATMYDGLAAWVAAGGNSTTNRPAMLSETGGAGLSDGDKGDVVVSGGGAVWTIDANVVDNSKLAQMGAYTLKGNGGSSTADPYNLTQAEVAALLADTVSVSKRLASGTSTIAANTSRSVVRRYTIVSGAHLVIAATGSLEVRS